MSPTLKRQYPRLTGIFLAALLFVSAIARFGIFFTPANPRCKQEIRRGDEEQTTDWWDCRELLPENERTFNKSIVYLKPHKTGSETFKEILLEISQHYNLTDERDYYSMTPDDLERLNPKYDVLLRHARHRDGKTEDRLRGWENGEFRVGPDGEAPARQIVRIVTIRNPVDRLFSQYFSHRRYARFVPMRGDVPRGNISEQEEVDDFVEWLNQYPTSQQVSYLMDKPGIPVGTEDGQKMQERIRKIVEYYDYVVVADEWKQSVCLFGFLERIDPTLLTTDSRRNKSWKRSKRFDTQAAVNDAAVFGKVLTKAKYDFILYQSLFKKFVAMLDETNSPELQRYCAAIPTSKTAH